jgi:hypothetical protein
VFPENGTRRFIAKIDDVQLQFIANFVKTVPGTNPIHLLMHIPLEEMTNRDALFEILKNHSNVYAYAGHTHTQYFRNFGKTEGWPNDEPLSELVGGAVCGAWWLGEKDIYGVPVSMMGDGTPKGYWILDIDGTSRKCTYKISGSAANKQMHIWTPPVSSDGLLTLDSNHIIVNIFAGNDSTKVKLKIEGHDWIVMHKVLEPDPFYSHQVMMQERDGVPDKIPYYRDKFPVSQHLWKSQIPSELKSGSYKLEVHARNNIGLEAVSKAILFIR